jgi:4-aminobutyrate aminotransferase-like enzyme
MMLSLILLWEKEWWRNACGRFTASTEMMDLLSDNPKLGHITTLGHPVIASACLATLQEITETDLMDRTLDKEKLLNFWYTL